jgi:hypothetical protein
MRRHLHVPRTRSHFTRCIVRVPLCGHLVHYEPTVVPEITHKALQCEEDWKRGEVMNYTDSVRNIYSFEPRKTGKKGTRGLLSTQNGRLA